VATDHAGWSARDESLRRTNRAETTPFDIVIEGETPGDDRERAGAIVRPWVEAGATWWIEARWEAARNAEGLQTVRQRIGQGRRAPLFANDSAQFLDIQVTTADDDGGLTGGGQLGPAAQGRHPHRAGTFRDQ